MTKTVKTMHTNEFIEQRIWEYIDGALSPDQAQEVSKNIVTDERWKAVHEQAMALSDRIRNLGPESPSMAFTSNVMRSLPAPTKRAKLSALPIWAIFVFFAVSILYVIAKTPQTSGTIFSSSGVEAFSLQQFFSNETTLAVFAGINILLALVFFDHLFRSLGNRNEGVS